MLRKCCVLLLLIIFFCSGAGADTLILKNGKTFEGDIYEFIDKVIRIKTAAGDKLVFKVNFVEDVQTNDSSEKKQSMIQDIRSTIKQINGNRRAKKYVSELEPIKKSKYSAPEYDWVPKPEVKQKEKEQLANVKTKKRRQKKVDVYITPTCPYCRKMIRFLKENHIRYSSYDVTRSPMARKKYKSFGGRSVPLTVIDNQATVRGYDPQKVLWLLEQ